MVLHNHKLPQSPFVGRGLCQCAPVRGTMPSAAEAGAVAHRHRDAPSPAQLRPVAAGGSLRVACRAMWRIAWSEWHGKLDPSQRCRRGQGIGARGQVFSHRCPNPRRTPIDPLRISCLPGRQASPASSCHGRTVGWRAPSVDGITASHWAGADPTLAVGALQDCLCHTPSPSELAATGFTTSAEPPFAPSTCKT